MDAGSLKILAIDDDQDNLTILRAAMARALPQARVLTAPSSRQGLELARAEDPDVILLDPASPGVDCLEVCRQLKADERLRPIPVLFLTAPDTKRATKIAALEAGAVGFVARPLDEAELAAQVRAVARGRGEAVRSRSLSTLARGRGEAVARIQVAGDEPRQERERLAALAAERTRALEQELAERRLVQESLRQANRQLQRSQAAALSLVDDLQAEAQARQQAEAQREAALVALRHSQAALLRAQQVAHLGHWTWHIASDRLEWSDEMYRIFGLNRETFSGDLPEVIAQAIHPDDRAEVERSNRSVIEHQKPIPLEYRVVWPDGTVRVVWGEAGELVLDEAGNPALLNGIVQDITERKKTESQRAEALDALRLRTEILNTVLDNIPVMVSFHSQDGPHRWVNRCWQQILGWSLAEAQSEDLLAELYPDPRARREVRSFIAAAEGTWAEFQTRTRDGRVADTLWATVSLEDGSSIGIGLDITGRKEAESQREAALEALHAAHAHLAATLNALPDLMFEIDAEGRIYDFRAPHPEKLHVPPEAFRGKTVDEVLSPEASQIIDGAIAEAAATGQHHGAIYCLQTPAGRQWFELSIAAKSQAPSPAARLIVLARDITARKQAEAEQARLREQLLQAHKLESIGRLAGGIAHDFNNMLSVILGRTELALRQIDPAHPLHANLDEVRHAAQRSADLTRQLLTFARKQIVAPRVIDLNKTIAGMLQMLRRLIGEDITLAWEPGTALWPVKIDPTQLDQILANLCLNARDAVAGKGRGAALARGTITVETTNVTCDTGYGAGVPGFAPGDYVQLAVSDDGHGMGPEVLANLFEPYFTTKAEGQSGGLGLATVYGAVRMNHGFVNVYSEPGRGTTFKIYLPRNEDQAVAAQARHPVVRGGQETVLLVEDEASILRLGKTILERLGYTVLTTDRPGEALRLAQAQPSLDLLVTDVVMPEMNGRELAARVKALHPGLRCLFMSGYTANIIAHQGVLDEGVWFLQKPFAIDDLAVKVRQVLDPPDP